MYTHIIFCFFYRFFCLAPCIYILIFFCMSDFSLLVQEYYKNPVNNYRIEDATISAHEGNALCGDDVVVYMKLQNTEAKMNATIASRSYDGNVSMITQAASSFFSELVVWYRVEEILQRNEQIMIDNEFHVSERRKRARVIAILATRNALHTWLWDWQHDTFDDVLL